LTKQKGGTHLGSIVEKQYRLKTGEKICLRTGVNKDVINILEHSYTIIAEEEFQITTPDEFYFSEKQGKQWIKEHNDNPDNILIVAESENKIIGMISFRIIPRIKLRHQGAFGLSVDKEWRDKGIGKLLVEILIEWGKDNSLIEKICLEVFSTNQRAIHLYKKLGFIEEGRRVKHVKTKDGEYVDLILMYVLVSNS